MPDGHILGNGGAEVVEKLVTLADGVGGCRRVDANEVQEVVGQVTAKPSKCPITVGSDNINYGLLGGWAFLDYSSTPRVERLKSFFGLQDKVRSIGKRFPKL
jgi:hypothetical protein